MWIEAENGTLYNTAHMVWIAIQRSGESWRLDAQFAVPLGESTATVTLKTFNDEAEAHGVLKNLKGRLERVILLVAPRTTG